MSLAPTLQKERRIVPGVGLVLMAGLLANLGSNITKPAQAAIIFNGRAPTATIGLGPVAQPTRTTLTVSGRQPTLGREKRIYPLLPEGTETTNDLTPTILLGSSDFAGTPQRAILLIEGRPPVLVLNGSTTIELSAALYPVNVQGLLPTVVLPVQFEGLKIPVRAEFDFLGLTPTLTTELVQPVAASSGTTLRGLTPTLVIRYSWQTVALGGEAVWTEVPRAF